MDTALIAALSGLAGALVGACATSLNTWISQRAETRRTRITQEEESRRHLRAALLRAAEITKHDIDQQIIRTNQQVQTENQLVNLPLTDYFIVALKFEKEFHRLETLDDKSLQRLADTIDGTFTELLIHRAKRHEENRRFREAWEKNLSQVPKSPRQ